MYLIIKKNKCVALLENISCGIVNFFSLRLLVLHDASMLVLLFEKKYVW